MPKLMQIVVNGKRYNSISAAWRELAPPGLPEITVRKRLELGWEPDDAFSIPAIEPEKRRINKLRRLLEDIIK